MLHRTYTWIKDVFFNIHFVFGVMLCFCIYLLGTLVWWYSGSLLYAFGAATTFSSFTFLFPLCAAIPYALRYRGNRKSHMDFYILQRCSVRRYLNGMLVKTALSGFAVMVAGTLVFLLFLLLFFPNPTLSYEAGEGILYPYMEEIARKENWALYFFVYALLLGISGVFWGLLALTLSAWIDNIYAILMFPILFLYVMDYAFMRSGFYSLSTLMFGMYFFDSLEQVLTYSMVVFGSMSLVCCGLFLIKGRRQCDAA